MVLSQWPSNVEREMVPGGVSHGDLRALGAAAAVFMRRGAAPGMFTSLDSRGKARSGVDPFPRNSPRRIRELGGWDEYHTKFGSTFLQVFPFPFIGETFVLLAT